MNLLEKSKLMNPKQARMKLLLLTVLTLLPTFAIQHIIPDASAAGTSQSTVTISLTKDSYCSFTTSSMNVSLPTPHPFYPQDILENASLEFICTETGTLLDWQIGPGQWSQGSLHRMRLQDRESYLPYSVVFNPPLPIRAGANPAETARVRFAVTVDRADITAAPAGIYTDSVTFTLSY